MPQVELQIYDKCFFKYLECPDYFSKCGVLQKKSVPSEISCDLIVSACLTQIFRINMRNCLDSELSRNTLLIRFLVEIVYQFLILKRNILNLLKMVLTVLLF